MRTAKSRYPVTAAVLVCLLALLGGPVAAYKIFLKDGTSHVSEQKYEVRGENAVFRLENGTFMSVPLEFIDLDQTERHNSDPRNSRRLDSAVVIDREGARPLDLDLLRDRSGASEGLAEQVQQARRAPAAPAGDRIELRKTTAGYEDFTTQPRLPLVQSELATALETTLRRTGLREFTTYRGTADRRPFIEVTTATAGEALEALEALARATVSLSEERPDVEALEVLLRTPNRARAGQFVLDKDNVRDLVDGLTTPGEYFVKFVQF